MLVCVFMCMHVYMRACKSVFVCVCICLPFIKICNFVFIDKPYSVIIEHGNEEERFTIKTNSSEAREKAKSKPPPRVYKNVTLHGEMVIICPNSQNSSTKIPRTHFGPQPFTGLFLSSVVLTLKNNLDYESTHHYLLNITVKDNNGNHGKLFIQVKILIISFFGCQG